MRSLIRRYIPAHFHDPIGLAARIVRSRDPSALFAAGSALMGLAAAPLDVLLSIYERRYYEQASMPQLPIILVIGPPRSGTTVVEQTLIRSLPVSYINNLAALFPRAPITANRLWGRPFANQSVELRSFYGRTSRLTGPNDALFLWDRWLGADRTLVQPEPSAENCRRMAQFFGAYEQAFGMPIVTKNNSLNAYASSVAAALPTAYFLCMHRDPVWLSQSLLEARRMIHGSMDVAYGIDEPHPATEAHHDPLRDVCRQVGFYRRLAEQQLDRIGPQRFWMVSYETFCQHPEQLVTRVAREILGNDTHLDDVLRQLPQIKASCRQRLPDEKLQWLQRHWASAADGKKCVERASG